MSGADEIIHQAVRLRIMAALNALAPQTAWIEFTRLKALVGATDGNLGAHLETLEKAGYIMVEKRFENSQAANARADESRRPPGIWPACRLLARNTRRRRGLNGYKRIPLNSTRRADGCAKAPGAATEICCSRARRAHPGLNAIPST